MISFLLLLFAGLPCARPRPCQHPSPRTDLRRAELIHLTALLNTPTTVAHPAPPEIVHTIQHYIPYAGLSYCPDDSVRALSCKHCRNATAKSTLEFYDFATDPGSKTHAVILVGSKRKEIVVSFRGSEDKWKAATLANSKKHPYTINGNQVGVVHRQSLNYLEKIRKQLTADLHELVAKHPDFVVVLVGHSLGGTLATLAAPILFSELQLTPQRLLVITYGQPRPGDADFRKLFLDMGFPYIRVVNEGDQISQHPSTGSGFTHIHNEINYKKGVPVRCADHAGEDQSCSYAAKFSFFSNYHSLVGREIVGSDGC